MRISRARLLILIALCAVILLELRTIAALFGVEISPTAAIAIGIVVIGTLVLWAVLSSTEESDRE